MLYSWSPHQQLPFVPIYFVSKLLVVPQQCFIPGSLIAASCLLLSFAVARSLPWLKDSWAGESSSAGSMGREGEQGGAGRGVFQSHNEEMAPPSCLLAGRAVCLKRGFTSLKGN